jgi:glycosyltransferase involved in cell wall biosynthesis
VVEDWAGLRRIGLASVVDFRGASPANGFECSTTIIPPHRLASRLSLYIRVRSKPRWRVHFCCSELDVEFHENSAAQSNRMSIVSTPPKVSIVIASYNRGELLVQAVQSALNQKGVDLEVVVSDDCSTDDSMDILAKVRDRRLRLNRQPKNVGVWLNWSAALAMAEGEYVVFLGDDDFLSDDFLRTHLSVFTRHPNLSAVFSPWEDRPVDGTNSKFHKAGIPLGVPSKAENVVEGLMRDDFFFGAAMFRRHVAQALWAQTKADDMVADWGLILGLATQAGALVSACEGCCYIKRVHRGRLSSRYVEISELISRVCRRYAGRCEQPRQRKILLDRVLLEQITLSRHFAAVGDMSACRSILSGSFRSYPLRLPLISQLLQAYFLPSRMMRTSRAQRGFKV